MQFRLGAGSYKINNYAHAYVRAHVQYSLNIAQLPIYMCLSLLEQFGMTYEFPAQPESEWY